MSTSVALSRLWIHDTWPRVPISATLLGLCGLSILLYRIIDKQDRLPPGKKVTDELLTIVHKTPSNQTAIPKQFRFAIAQCFILVA